jgi:probable phosphoglycerate mutase
MTKFLLIRHATTDAVGKNLSGRTKGISLNAKGQLQAQQVSARLAHVPIDAIYSSPLERALETAAPIAAAHQLTLKTNFHFLELNFGDWTNRTFDALQHDPQFKLFNSFRSNTRIPGGETMLEAQARFITGMQQLCDAHAGQVVAIVSHADLIKAAITYYAGIHLDLFQRVEISPASVSIVEVYAETARILLVNDTGQIP